ncbi:DUF7667 family protein [Paenibacillus koleovorans]|uniref:DUF7667 family protein n=1 Tax=Paenibacillus koleovorans TaxID=121608 RepID=UPI000FDAA9F7|nr:hypothetical protein [Paenibacillus koleovorans]
MVVTLDLSDSPIICRIAQLRVVQKARGLDPVQLQELKLCLDWIVNYCWRQALLKNQALKASMTNDVDWLHELCRDLDGSTTKKPGRLGTD